MSFDTITTEEVQSKSNSKEYLDSKVAAQAVISPISTSGVMGWIFDIPKNEEVRLSSEITDHFTESNTFINDHIVRKPIRITLSGFIGELVYRKSPANFGDNKVLGSRLTPLDAFQGQYSPGAGQAIRNSTNESEISKDIINKSVDKSKNIVTPFDGLGLNLAQRKAYGELFALWKANFPLTCITPWTLYPLMIIEEIVFIQNEDSNTYSDITITLKEIRFARTKTVEFDEESADSREQIQSTDPQNTGNVKGSENSVLFDALIGGS